MSGLSHLTRLLGVSKEVDDPLGQGPLIARLDEVSILSLFDEFRKAADAGRNHRLPGGHVFEDGDRLGLDHRPRGEHRHIKEA